MNTFSIFINSLLPNLGYILPVLLVVITTSLVGFVLLRRFIKDDEWFVIFPAAVITGLFSFILFLGVFSYVFKGSLGIWIILVGFVAFGYFLAVKQKDLTQISWPKFSLAGFLVLGIILIWFLFITLTAGNNIYGGDVIAYWGFATSFANGNYPMMSPWQPDILANHHQGVYLYEGAIFALTNVNISLIHTIFSVTVISAGLLLLWGMIRKLSGYTFLSLFPALVFYIAFGAIFLPLPLEMKNNLPYEVSHEISKWPIFTDAKNRLGGSSNLNEIFYINHRAAAFAGMFLVMFLLTREWKVKKEKKMVLLALLVIPIISADEVVLPAIAFGALVWWIGEIWKKDKKEVIHFSYWTCAAILTLVVMFFVLGSALRDSMLTPSNGVLRFQVFLRPDFILARISEMNGAILEFPGGILYLPSLFAYFFLAVVGARLVKKRDWWIMIAGSLGILLAFLTVEHTFYPGNQGRFLHLIYLILGLVISGTGVMLISSGNKRKFLGIVFILLFIPSVFTSSVYLALRAKSNDYPNYKGDLPDYPVLKWYRQNLSDKRILFIDGYLRDQSYSYLTLGAIQNYGLLVPVSPASVKVHTPDFGVEMIDIISSLDPKSLKDLKVDYIYIKNNQLKFYSPFIRQRIEDKSYFQTVYSDKDGRVYFISDKYKDIGADEENTLRQLSTILTLGADIYLDAPPVMDMPLRSAMLLSLKGVGTIYTKQSSGTFNYIETDLPFKNPTSQESYDYLFLSPLTDPLTLCNCSRVENFWNVDGVIGYKAYYE